jgi:prolyl-tRNA editing enzyme YbaK/EbsC (Cys-tRNA(Pro) deacylase)
VPPFGHLTPLPTFIDEDFWRFEIVWAAAGTPNSVFPLSPDELKQVTNATVAKIKLDRSD